MMETWVDSCLLGWIGIWIDSGRQTNEGIVLGLMDKRLGVWMVDKRME